MAADVPASGPTGSHAASRGSRGSGREEGGNAYEQPPTSGDESVRIAYCDGPRLRRALLASAEYLSAHRSELNRINVFPVADGDTGTNLALTLRHVADAVRSLETDSVSEVAEAAAEASVMGARGNSGMIISHFLLNFARGLGQRIRVGLSELADALYRAGVSLGDALESPVEGTILTVARAAALEARRCAARRDDLYAWLQDVRSAAQSSLEQTRDSLPALREAGVVDAGAKGFVNMLEGTLRYIDGRPLEPPGGEVEGGNGEPRLEARSPEEGRYCTQIAIRGEALPVSSEIQSELEGLGSSLIVLRSGSLAKVHIHADDPGAVEERLASFGTVETRRVEDTRSTRTDRRVAVVTDSSCDLPRAWIRERGVEVVPLQLIVGEKVYRDGVEVDSSELLAWMRDDGTAHPRTSQPAPAAFTDAYGRAFDRGAERLLGVFLSGAVSGTFDAGLTAARALEEESWRLVDSRTGSLGLGMMVVRAVELFEEGASLEQVAEELSAIRDRSGLYFTVDDLKWLRRSGRVSRGRAWLGTLLDLRPLLTVNRAGEIVPCARVRGRDAARAEVLDRIDGALEGAERYRVGVVHAGIPAFASELEQEIQRRYDAVETFCRPLTAVLTAHLGPGAWGVCYQIES